MKKNQNNEAAPAIDRAALNRLEGSIDEYKANPPADQPIGKTANGPLIRP